MLGSRCTVTLIVSVASKRGRNMCGISLAYKHNSYNRSQVQHTGYNLIVYICIPEYIMHVYDVVEAHCYVVNIGQTDRELIRSRINNNWCRTFRPHRPLSTMFCTQLTKAYVFVLHQLLLILLRICSRSVRPMYVYACVYVAKTKGWNVHIFLFY